MAVSWTHDASLDSTLQSPGEGLLPRASGTAAVTSRAACIEGRFAELYRTEFAYVWRSARRLGVSHAEADDIVQETFVIVHRLLGSYELNGSPRPWLFALLFRVVQRHHRSHRRRNAHTDADANVDAIAAPPAAAPDRAAETTETVRLLEGILEKLDPDKRAVLVLADLEERPLAEIAEILGIHERTATSRLRAAREHLDASLARHRARDGWRFNVSSESEKRRSALLPLANIYEPTDADAARVLTKVRASLDSGVGFAHPAATARTGFVLKLAGLSCIALALLGGSFLKQNKGDRTSPPTEAPVGTLETARAVATNGEPMDEPRAADDSPSRQVAPSVPVAALPNAPTTATAVGAQPQAPGNTSRSAAAPADGAPADTLAEEARLLAQARHALRGGDNERGLALLDEHARTFPNGWFASDRAVERIVALCSLGRRDEARREAKAFLARHPNSPLTRRIGSSCAAER
jgi:RNA polymerase sigma-70 factor, ECF subfamily